MTMKWKRRIALAALSAALAAVTPIMPPTEALCAQARAVPMDCPERADEVFYQNSGMRLFIPRELVSYLVQIHKK